MQIARWLLKALGGIVAGLALALGVWALLPARTAPIDGANAIAALERVTLGGAEQTILLRGRDRALPLLLWIHGGPGFAQLPIAAPASAMLEQHFVVVSWDQRGAGASCDGFRHDFGPVTQEQIVADAIELSERLAARFGGRPIFVLGHSWGSLVGALAVQRRPDLYAAYVGLGQLVNGPRNEELSYQFVLDEATKRGDAEALAELATVHPPYASFDDLGVQRRWLGAYRGSLYAVDRASDFLVPALFGREYTLATRVKFVGCFRRSIERLWGSLDGFDALTQIPRLDVPVFFFTGRHDWNTPFPLVEEWAARLEAPRVELVWFEGAGHVPPLEVPEAFQRALVEKLTPLAPR